MALHILDIAENSIRAGAKRIDIRIFENVGEDELRIEIEDDGAGMAPEEAERAISAFHSTKGTSRVGLGLPLLSQAARAVGGKVEIDSREGRGTTVKATFGYSHIDRKPLGDVVGTLVTLVSSNEKVDFSFYHCKSSEEFRFETAELREELEGVPLGHPQVVALIRDALREGLREIGASVSLPEK